MELPLEWKFIRSLPDLYLIVNPQLNIVEASDAYLNATFTKREEVVGRGMFEVFTGDENEAAAICVRNVKASFERILINKTTETLLQKYDIRQPEALGGKLEERYWSIINSFVLGENKEVIYLIHRVQDITELIQLKKIGTQQTKLTEELKIRANKMETEIFLRAQEMQKANEKLHHINKELLASELIQSKLAAIVESTDDAIFSKSSTGIVESWNKGAEKLYGYTANEIIGKTTEFLFPTEKMDEYFYIEQQIKNGEPVILSDTQRKHKNGHIIPIAITISPIQNKNGEIIGACSLARSIIEWKSRENMILNQQEAIRKLSIPILQLHDELLMLPIIGILDEERSRQITKHLLNAIRHKRAKMVLLDITGMPSIDAQIANLLIKTIEAAKLMGAKLIITGLSSEVSRTLINIGVDLNKISTLGDLQSGIREANRLTQNS